MRGGGGLTTHQGGLRDLWGGYRPSRVLRVHARVKLIVDCYTRAGLAYMRHSVSDNAE